MSETATAASAAAHLRDFHEDFGAYALAAQYRLTAHRDACPVLALHGARSDLHRWRALLEPLQALGVGSLAPSLSGHGPHSPMPVEQTSLAQNFNEALRFAAHAGPSLRMVMGSSMGGALAMRVAEALNAQSPQQIQVLVLCGPALYPEAAWQAAHFGAPFRDAISTPFGFMASRSLDFLRRFTDRVLLVQGEWDGLQATDHGAPAGRSAGEVPVRLPDGRTRSVWSPIPAEVFTAIRNACGPRLQHIVLEQCDHRVGVHFAQHPGAAAALARLLHAALHAPQGDAQGSSAAALRITTEGELVII